MTRYLAQRRLSEQAQWRPASVLIKGAAALSPCAPGCLRGLRAGAHGQLADYHRSCSMRYTMLRRERQPASWAVLAGCAGGGWEEAGMLGQIAEWAGAVLAAGVVAGLVVLAAGAAGVWWLCRRLRRRVAAFTTAAARYARQAAGVAAAAKRGRLPPRVVGDLRRRINGPPGLW